MRRSGADGICNTVASKRGCTIDQLCPCTGPDSEHAWKNADQYQRCVKRKARNFRRHRLITGGETGDIREAARVSGCGATMPQEDDTDGDTLGDACDRDNDSVGDAAA